MRRVAALLIATTTAVVAGLGLAAVAWGPPAVGEPLLGASVRCAPYGSSFDVTASSFRPGTAVTISNPAGSYAGPPRPDGVIAPVTATADPTGTVKVKLRVGPAHGAPAGSYRAATIWADGPGIVDGQRATVFTGVVVTSKAACQQLEHPTKAKAPAKKKH